METENTDQIFMDKVNKILEKNLSTDKYTIDKLSIDIGMSRTAFYSRIREITGNPPENYIYSFKMDRALKLLASHSTLFRKLQECWDIVMLNILERSSKTSIMYVLRITLKVL